MNPEPEPVASYDEYLEAVRQQEQRDRDRFTGADEHPGEPMYSAANGAPAIAAPMVWTGRFWLMRELFEDLAIIFEDLAIILGNGDRFELELPPLTFSEFLEGDE